ncbi:hypothetical protein EON62_01955 [archaeon]|nr:MAG: hypothetical protein EON62_01955 [archaeon]
MYNKCFFFPEEGADSELVPILQRLGGGVSSRVAGGAGADAAGADGGAPVAEHHAPDAGGDDASQMPFEFFVFETMLSAVVEELTNQYNSIRPQASEVVLQLTEHRAATAKLFERLRYVCVCAALSFMRTGVLVYKYSARGLCFCRKVKRSLADFLSRLKSINRVLSELLDTSEDLRSMALTALVGVEGAASTAGSAFVDSSVLDDYEDAAEVLLESYLAEVEAVITKAKLAREDVEASEHQLNLVLANNRNRLLKTEIGITTMTMTMTACSVVAGIFGMCTDVQVRARLRAHNHICASTQ